MATSTHVSFPSIFKRAGVVLTALFSLTTAAPGSAFSTAPQVGAAAPNYFKPAQLVQLPDGRKVNLVCIGEGGPTVVLLAGLGLPTEAWGRVQPLVGRKHRTCALDQPGYRFTDLPTGPITAVETASDLQKALRAANLPSPYLLVAHSRAGFDARQFAHLFPKETAGLVLLDVNVDFEVSPETKARMEAPDPARPCIQAAAEERLTPSSPLFVKCGSPPPGSPALNEKMARATLSQSDNLKLDAKSARQIRSYGRLPMIVITAVDIDGKWGGDATAQRNQSQAHASLAAQSKKGEHRLMASGHLIMMEQPQAVAQAVEDAIASAAP